MVEFKLDRELEREIELFPDVNWQAMVEDFIRAKTFELELERSKEMQRGVFEALAAKSKLTEEDARELGDKVKEGMLKELKDKGLV